MINEFDDRKYNLENYMQIIQYNSINYNSGYDADTETKYIDPKFNAIMNILSDKLAAFTMAY